MALDAQHGLLGYSGVLNGLIAIDAGHTAVGMVRVEANDPTAIGKALDAGAVGVIVPLVNTAEDAAAAVAASQVPAAGRPLLRTHALGAADRPDSRRGQRRHPGLRHDRDARKGLANVKEICPTPGLDGIYVGPSDLAIAVGGAFPGDPAVEDEFNAALETIADAAAAAGVAAGIHTPAGEVAAQRLRQGYTFTTIASDLTHLELAAKAHLAAATAKD